MKKSVWSSKVTRTGALSLTSGFSLEEEHSGKIENGI